MTYTVCKRLEWNHATATYNDYYEVPKISYECRNQSKYAKFNRESSGLSKNRHRRQRCVDVRPSRETDHSPNGRDAFKLLYLLTEVSIVQEGNESESVYRNNYPLRKSSNCTFSSMPAIGQSPHQRGKHNLFSLSAIPTSKDFAKASECTHRPHIVLHFFWNKELVLDTFIKDYVKFAVFKISENRI